MEGETDMFNCAPPNFNMVQPKVSEALEEDIEKHHKTAGSIA